MLWILFWDSNRKPSQTSQCWSIPEPGLLCSFILSWTVAGPWFRPLAGEPGRGSQEPWATSWWCCQHLWPQVPQLVAERSARRSPGPQGCMFHAELDNLWFHLRNAPKTQAISSCSESQWWSRITVGMISVKGVKHSSCLQEDWAFLLLCNLPASLGSQCCLSFCICCHLLVTSFRAARSSFREQRTPCLPGCRVILALGSGIIDRPLPWECFFQRWVACVLWAVVEQITEVY